MSYRAFKATGDTVNIVVSAATQVIEIVPAGDVVRIFNGGTATVFIKFGASNVTATLAAGIPIGAGVTEIETPKERDTNNRLYVAAIAVGASGTIYFTPGVGI